jgi:hypothetical protein
MWKNRRTKPRVLVSDRRVHDNSTQKIPWHCHSNIFYVVPGQLRIFLRDPKEEVRLAPGETYSVRSQRLHLVTNGGETPATFVILQGIGEYDFFPFHVNPKRLFSTHLTLTPGHVEV